LRRGQQKASDDKRRTITWFTWKSKADLNMRREFEDDDFGGKE